MNSGGESTAAQGALALGAAAETLLEAPLYSMSDDEVIELMQDIETITRQLDAAKQRLVLECGTRNLPARAGVKSPVRFLQETLRLSHGDAAARVRNTELLSALSEGTFERPPVLPLVAQAQRAGEISLDHIRAIHEVIKQIPAGADAEAKDFVERNLTVYARQGDPAGITTLGVRVLLHIDPDGSLTEHRDQQMRRGFTIGHPRADGMAPVSGWVTPQFQAVVSPVLEKLARPGMCNPDDPESPWSAAELGIDTDADDGTGTDGTDSSAEAADTVDSSMSTDEQARAAARAALRAAATRDHRTAAQRNHDAVIAFLRPDMGPTRLGNHRGLPVSTVITMSINDLEQRTGKATTATGGTLSIRDAVELAANATPYLVIIDADGRPLHFARGERLATPEQRLALTAVERGCTRPGCDAPATRSAVHHIKEWADGGETDIENLTFACDACHAQVNSGPNGWKTIVMPEDSEHPGKTGWIPPPHIDPARRPRVNFRHHPQVRGPSGIPGIPARRLC